MKKPVLIPEARKETPKKLRCKNLGGSEAMPRSL